MNRGWRFGGRVLLLLAIMSFTSGCSDEASSDGADGNGNGGPPLFMQAPDCDNNTTKLEGTFLGAAVMDAQQTAGGTVLVERQYYTIENQSRLYLRWASALEADVVQPLTAGAYVRTFWDVANPTLLYCVVAGEIGFVGTDIVDDEYFKYSITRVRSGEVGMTQYSVPATCDGTESDVLLVGCVNRFN